MTDRGSLVGVVAAALPSVSGVGCVGLSAGVATAGGVAGATVAWVTPLLFGVALVVAGALLLRARSQGTWRRWHGLAAVASASYLLSAVVLVPVLVVLVGGGGSGGEVLP